MNQHRSFKARPLHALIAALVAFGSVAGGALAASAAAAEGDGTAFVSGNTLVIIGTNGADAVDLQADATSALVMFDHDAANGHRFDLGDFTAIAVSLGNGGDRFTEQSGVLSTKALAVDGGNGDDVIQTGDGNDTIASGNGDDRVDAGRGNDVVSLGNGSDFFVWTPGEGSDVVDGGPGSRDAMLFIGSNASETMSLSANGAHAVFLRDVGGVRMDLTDLEILDLRAAGGADKVTIDDLEATSIREVNIDLSDGHGSADHDADVVTVKGTDGPDHVHVSAADGQIDVGGLRAETRITGSETLDRLQVETGGGNDRVTVDPNVSNEIDVAVDLGTGQV